MACKKSSSKKRKMACGGKVKKMACGGKVKKMANGGSTENVSWKESVKKKIESMNKNAEKAMARKRETRKGRNVGMPMPKELRGIQKRVSSKK